MVQRDKAPEEVSDIEKYIQEKFTFQDALDDAGDIDVSIDDDGGSITVDTNGTELDLVIQDIVDALEQANNVSVNVDNQPISIDDDGATLTVDTDSGPIDIFVTGQPISIDDNGSSLTIDTSAGPIDVNQSGSVSINEPLTVDSPNSENFENHPHGRQPDGDLIGDKASGVADTFTGSLNVDETYTSDWIDTDGFEAVEVFVSADVRSQVDGVVIEYTDDAQATTPTVRGSRDRTFTEEDAGAGFEDFQFPTNLDGFRIKYTNNGFATSSNFAIFTTLSPTLALDSADYVGEGALGETFVRIGSNENGNGIKIGGPTSLFEDIETIERTTLVDLSSSFGTSILNDEIKSTGSGVVAQDPDDTTGEIVLSTGTTADSEIDVRTAEYGRYTPGFSAQAGMGIRVSSLPDEGRLEWGYFDENNGFLFGYDGSTGEFFVARKKDGTIVELVNQPDFNRADFTDVFERDFSLAEGQIFQIDFSWYGYGIVLFKVVSQIDNTVGASNVPRQETTTLHALKVKGETSTEEPNQPIRVRATNGANGDDNRIRIGGRQFSVSGQPSEGERDTGQSRLDFTVADGSWTHVQSWQRADPLTDANARLNIDGMDFGIDQTVRVAIVINANISGQTYSGPDLIPTDETQLEYANDGTFDGIGDGTKVWEGSIRVASGGPSQKATFNPEVNVRLGQTKTMSVIAQCDGGSGNADMTTRMLEDF